MTMLQRITTVLERARVAGGWIDEDVARAVLREMREADEAMITRVMEKGPLSLGYADAMNSVKEYTYAWRAMIDAALNEDPAHE